MKRLTSEELDRIEWKIKEKIDEREGRGDFDLWACVECIISGLKRGDEGDLCDVRRTFLNNKERQGMFFNDRMFAALNMVEAEIYGLRY